MRAIAAMTRGAAVVLLLGACHSYKPIAAPASAVGQQVRVLFSQPRALTGTRAPAPDSTLVAVSALEGRVAAVVGDTLRIAVTRLTDAAGDHPVTTPLLVAVLPAPSVAIDVLAVDKDRSATAAGIGIVAVGYVLTIVLVASILAVAYR